MFLVSSPLNPMIKPTLGTRLLGNWVIWHTGKDSTQNRRQVQPFAYDERVGAFFQRRIKGKQSSFIGMEWQFLRRGTLISKERIWRAIELSGIKLHQGIHAGLKEEGDCNGYSSLHSSHGLTPSILLTQYTYIVHAYDYISLTHYIVFNIRKYPQIELSSYLSTLPCHKLTNSDFQELCEQALRFGAL